MGSFPFPLTRYIYEGRRREREGGTDRRQTEGGRRASRRRESCVEDQLLTPPLQLTSHTNLLIHQPTSHINIGISHSKLRVTTEGFDMKFAEVIRRTVRER